MFLIVCAGIEANAIVLTPVFLFTDAYTQPGADVYSNYGYGVAVVSTLGGIDSWGRTWTAVGKSAASIGCLSLYAESSLSGGNPSGPSFGQIANVVFQVDLRDYSGQHFYVSSGLVANGHGRGTTGDGNTGYSDAVIWLGSGGNTAQCGVALSGDFQSCSTGTMPAYFNLTIRLSANVYANSPTTNDSAYIDYWGTFDAASLDIYDQNMNLIETINIGSFAPTPEPSSIALFGTGALGLIGAFRRKAR